MKKTFIIIFTIFVLFFLFIGLTSLQEKECLEGQVSVEESRENIMKFINEDILMGRATASLLNLIEENGVYKITVELEGEEIDAYVSLDNKLFFPEAFDMVNLPEREEEDFSQDENIKNLVSCLEKEEFIIYGADWCGFCRQVVELFGGYAMVDPIYVECTDNPEICNKENIEGYPTIKIKGEIYTGQRTLEAFALGAGCSF